MTARELFAQGREVNLALPSATLKPSDAGMNQAAVKLGISQAQAWRAWTRYTWGDQGFLDKKPLNRRLPLSFDSEPKKHHQQRQPASWRSK